MRWIDSWQAWIGMSQNQRFVILAMIRGSAWISYHILALTFSLQRAHPAVANVDPKMVPSPHVWSWCEYVHIRPPAVYHFGDVEIGTGSRRGDFLFGDTVSVGLQLHKVIGCIVSPCFFTSWMKVETKPVLCLFRVGRSKATCLKSRCTKETSL